MKILKIALAILLLLCLFNLPYGYYQFIRVAAFVVLGIAAYEQWQEDRKGWAALYLIGALLFNPIWKVYLGRELWMVADVVWAVVIGVELAMHHYEENHSKPSLGE